MGGRWWKVTLACVWLSAQAWAQDLSAIYRPYVEARQTLSKYTSQHGQLILRLTPQERAEFAQGFGGAFPVTPAGSKIFGEQFDEAFLASRLVCQRGQEAVRHSAQLGPGQRSLLLALLPVWGGIPLKGEGATNPRVWQCGQ